MSLVQVLIDSREPAWVQKLTFGGVPVAVDLLDAGDVLGLCADGALIAIERKTAGDFLHTLAADRLFAQMQRLRETTPWAYLAICGALTPAAGGSTFCDGRRTDWGWRAVTGALLDVQQLGVGVVSVAGDFDFEAEVCRLASRSRSTISVVPPRSAVPLSDAERILTSFPGIGLEKARALLGECGTAAKAIWYLNDPGWASNSVAGVADGLRQRARDALGLDPGRILIEFTGEQRIEMEVA